MESGPLDLAKQDKAALHTIQLVGSLRKDRWAKRESGLAVTVVRAP